jgi:carbonic anhydrase/acetyltransferase-like protein (isoleucine patch superfamily)
MIYRNHAGDKPVVHATATIHPSAVVTGIARMTKFAGKVRKPNVFLAEVA